MAFSRLAGLVTGLTLLALAQIPQAAEESDRVTGLARNGDWQLVQANCTECHSALLITQNSGKSQRLAKPHFLDAGNPGHG